uniref:Putative secreted protein n=1 Tax=Anopheles darlingi TaxID=43151 RepID=A0A2M4DF94_ANODA
MVVRMLSAIIASFCITRCVEASIPTKLATAPSIATNFRNPVSSIAGSLPLCWYACLMSHAIRRSDSPRTPVNSEVWLQ